MGSEAALSCIQIQNLRDRTKFYRTCPSCLQILESLVHIILIFGLSLSRMRDFKRKLIPTVDLFYHVWLSLHVALEYKEPIKHPWQLYFTTNSFYSLNSMHTAIKRQQRVVPFNSLLLMHPKCLPWSPTPSFTFMSLTKKKYNETRWYFLRKHQFKSDGWIGGWMRVVCQTSICQIDRTSTKQWGEKDWNSRPT